MHLLPVMQRFAASDTCAEPQIAERLALRIEAEQFALNAKDILAIGHQTFRRDCHWKNFRAPLPLGLSSSDRRVPPFR